MKYRMSEIVHGQAVTQELAVQSLYKRCVRKAWQSIHGQKYQAKAVDKAKQPFGFQKEQSNHYAAYIASIHLTAIRFYLLVIANRDTLITSALDGLKAVLGDGVH